MAYFNLHKMQELILQLNLIVGNSLDESIKIVPHRLQTSLIDSAEGGHDYAPPPRLSCKHSANEHLSACGRQELQVLLLLSL